MTMPVMYLNLCEIMMVKIDQLNWVRISPVGFLSFAVRINKAPVNKESAAIHKSHGYIGLLIENINPIPWKSKTVSLNKMAAVKKSIAIRENDFPFEKIPDSTKLDKI